MTFYTAGLGGDCSAAARTFINAQAANLTNDMIFTFPSSGDMIDDATGNIVGAWSGSLPAPVVGSSGASYMQGVGYQVKWLTAGVVNKRHVKGRTFFTACSGSSFDANGTLDTTVATGIQTAATAFITANSGNLRIWSRPAPGRAGSSHAVTTGSPVSRVAWLKTRKY